jgi:hypothetical protein
LVHGAGREAKTAAFPPTLGTIWRLAAADRIDRAWVATASGDVLLVDIAARLSVFQVVHTGLVPFDFAAIPSAFALVSVTEQAGQPRRFSLNVFSRAGTQLYSYQLAVAQVTADPDWASRASANEEVVIGEAPPRVAVGGPTSLRVFELHSGKELFAR